MQIVPLKATPNQTLTTLLDGQVTQINLYQKGTSLYMDILLDGVAVVYGAICENENRIIRTLYEGFAGDLAFLDNQGSADPVYTGLGATTDARFVLCYIEAAELPAGEG